jgi:hypothetical protein
MIVAVIPTRYEPPALAELLAVLDADKVTPIVLASEEFEHRIYRMWNAGVAEARAKGADYIAILNDDVGLPVGALHGLSAALAFNPDVGVVYPNEQAPWGILGDSVTVQRTTGTWGGGGMTGFCFMFRAADALPAFDEGYHWWYGDDAWERAVREAGYGVARVLGVPVRHTPNGSAWRDWQRLAPLIERDRARWEATA